MTTHAPLPRRSAEEQARLDDAIRELFEKRITFNQVLGLEVVKLDPVAGPTVRFAMRPDLVGHYLYGRLHGGVIAAVLDTLGGLALMVAQGEKHADESADQVLHRFMRMGTIDLRVDYLRPGLGKAYTGTTEVTRLGGRIGSTLMRLHDEHGKLIATATGAYVLS